jgi:hypothetical protein
MESKAVFNARFVSTFSPDRVYRVYVVGNELFFIRIGGQGGVREGVTGGFGLAGGLAGGLLDSRAEKKRGALIQNIDQADPQQLLSDHKHNFTLTSTDFQGGTMEPPSSFAGHGRQVGRWKFNLRDGRKMSFEFEKPEDLRAALDILPKLLGSELAVNVEWNEAKKRFEKSKVQS